MRVMITLRNSALAATALLLLGCSDGAPPEGNNAVLITLDTVRADALTCYEGIPGLTPHLDELATEGVLFEKAYAVAPLTLPSHGSMLTGLYPPRHTLRVNSDSSLPLSAETLAETARGEDIETAAIIAAVVLDDAYRLDQGFEHYDAPLRTGSNKTMHYPDRTHTQVLEEVDRWMEGRDRGRRFFLWVHLWDAHGPWNPPEEFIRKSQGNPYLAEVAVVDAAVGRIMEKLRVEGVLENTVVLVIGDHGEAFMEHGEVSHGAYCYEPTLRVPMILRYPDGTRAGERNEGVVSVVDVYPTLAEALALPIPPGIDGQSLYGAPLPPDRGVYFESFYGYIFYGWSPIWGWIDGEGKYVHSSEPEFFHLSSDPGEQENLVASRPDDLERYRDAIRAIASRPPLERGEAVDLEGGLGEDLAALGYASSGTREIELPPPLTETGLPSAAATAEELRLIVRATELFGGGDREKAEALHRQVLEKNPNNFHSREMLGFFLMSDGKYGEAAKQFWRVLASERGSASAATNLGICKRRGGQDDVAIHWFEKALEIDANHIGAIRHLGQLHRKLENEAEADAFAKRYEQLTGEKLPPENPGRNRR
jgi:arylsulfatase A-like enzyme